jgi:hypothetical protein
MKKTLKLLTQWRFADFGFGFVELFWMCFFGLMPLWLGFIYLRFRGAEPAVAFVIGFIDDGELLIVAVALIGPLMYPLLRQYGDGGVSIPFPVNWVFVAGIIALSFLASGLFYQLKVDTLRQAHLAQSNVDEPYVLVVSLFGCGAAIFLTFLILSIRNLMDRIDIPRYFRSDTVEMIQDWQR